MDHDYLPGSKDAEVTDADIYQALVASEGNISTAAKELCISRTRCKQRIDKNIVLTALLLDMVEEIVDVAAGNIFRDVRANDPTMNRFVAQTLGKERGFSTGVAGMGKNGEIVVQINRLSETKED